MNTVFGASSQLHQPREREDGADPQACRYRVVCSGWPYPDYRSHFDRGDRVITLPRL